MIYQRTREIPFVCHSTALHAFDSIVAIAKKRGFKSRKQLIGAVRRGSGTEFALEKARNCCSLLTDAELQAAFANAQRSARW
jgi:hypothetical protein